MDLDLSALDMLPADEQSRLLPCGVNTCLLITCSNFTNWTTLG
ncbi:ALQxL family class IV lanthipeptide [Sphaerisporangium fuscum]|nr:ALQxL family class IV lanthipeptide [Sphaerisporangium fuscum]